MKIIGNQIKGIRSSLLAVLVVLSSFVVKGQDIHFSQFTMTPMLLDASQAGKIGGDVREFYD